MRSGSEKERGCVRRTGGCLLRALLVHNEGQRTQPQTQRLRPFAAATPHEIAARARHRRDPSNKTHLLYRFQSTGPQPSSPSSAFAREKMLLPVNGVAVFVLLRG